MQKGPGEEELQSLSLYFVQFVFFWQFVLYPPVRFSFVKPGCLIWTANKFGVYICFFHFISWGGFNPENKKYNLS